MAHCNLLFPQELKSRGDAGKDVTFPQVGDPCLSLRQRRLWADSAKLRDAPSRPASPPHSPSADSTLLLPRGGTIAT